MNFYGAGVDEFLYNNYFTNIYDGFFVECGASDGQFMSVCKFFEETMKWTGINIEPVPSYYSRLVENRPNCRNINLALSNINCVKEFVNPVADGIPTPGWGSLSWNDDFKKTYDVHHCTYDKFNVNCVLFSEIFVENKVIDLFVLDVEGHEVEALEGILHIKKAFYPKIFCIETSQNDKIKTLLGSDYEGVAERLDSGNFIFRRKY
jgi:FkbM family methyltransferase